ncbi:MAG: accessory Sec system glycosylation protein GtfA, partial [Lachnospiraceae bacterium]|nr:accessory Sec system glycosylation protein GtfA [Lachnospiraceae bacterium]
MSVYILGRPEAYQLAGLDYGETCRQLISEEISGQVRYVCTDLIEQRDIECYQKAGIDREKIFGIHQYLTGSNVLFPNIKVEDKLAELKEILQFTDTGHRESEIRLIKDGFVVAAVLPDEEDKSCVRAVHYYSSAKLLRTEVYTDRVFYVNYYVTAKSETGLYAKLTRRTFYDRNGSTVYDQM